MSDTPRTDAYEGFAHNFSKNKVVPSFFSRELERENAALLLKIQDLELQNNAMRSTSRGKEVSKNELLERENAALRAALDAQMQYQRDLRADRDRLDWLDLNLPTDAVCCAFKRVILVGQLRAAIDAARKEAQP